MYLLYLKVGTKYLHKRGLTRFLDSFCIMHDGVNYELLEKIKNGRTVAAKFDSKELKFKTPNTVVVFSNEKPDVTELYLLHC